MTAFGKLLIALAIWVSGAPVASQQTFVVDSLMRPGAHFATVSAALWAARDGDTVQVRSSPQMYFEAGTVSKALTIEGIDAGYGRPFVRWLGIQVGYLTTNQQVICKNIDSQSVIVMDCSGLVHFEDCGARFPWPSLNAQIWYIRRCAQVSMVRCLAYGSGGWPGVYADGSHLTLNHCELRGAEPVTGPPRIASAEALRLVNGVASLSQCILAGGSGNILAFSPPSPAIAATNSRLIVAGDENCVLASGTSGPLPPIDGTSVTLDLDPRVRVTSSDGVPVPPAPSVVVRRHAICRVDATMVPRGGMRDVVVSTGGGEPGFAVLLLGLPDTPMPVANGYWYLGGFPPQLIMVTRTSRERLATWKTTIPSANAWGGFRVAFQVVSLGARVEPGGVIHVAL